MAESLEDELIETDEEKIFVPRTIQRYLRTLENNNKGSIFDIDDSLDPTPNVDDVMMRDNGDVVRILPGRGRGAIREYYTGRAPGLPCIDDLEQMIRKVNPSGYFEDTEKLSRAFQDKLKGHKSRTNCSPQRDPVIPLSSSCIKSESSSPSGTTTSEISSEFNKSSETKLAKNKPLPMSQMLIQSRKKKEHLLRMKQLQKNIEDEEASQRTIQRLLKEDKMESGTVQFSSDSTTSSGDELSWRRRTDSPPRYTWRSESKSIVDVSSIQDFPPLK